MNKTVIMLALSLLSFSGSSTTRASTKRHYRTRGAFYRHRCLPLFLFAVVDGHYAKAVYQHRAEQGVWQRSDEHVRQYTRVPTGGTRVRVSNSVSFQRSRECADDVGKATVLMIWVEFPRRPQEREAMSCVQPVDHRLRNERDTLGSLVRNRFASSSGSSPTTRPSGIRTPRSMTTFFSRACRPTFT